MDREGLPAFATDPVDSAAARWERWLNRFTNFAVAKNITDARRLKAILLHYVGEDVIELSESLGIVSDTPFEETKRILTAYVFRPPPPPQEMLNTKCSFSARRNSTQMKLLKNSTHV